MPQSRNKKQSFTFNSFYNGITTDPTLWKTHGAYSAGLDLAGITEEGGYLTGARPNTLQLSQNLDIDTGSGTIVSGLMSWMTQYDGLATGDLFGFETDNPYALYRKNTNAWTNVKTTSAANGGGGLAVFNNYLWYGQNSVLGQATSAGVYTNNFASFTNTSITPRPMKTFAGLLMIGNDRDIATVDGSGTFTAQQTMRLPVGYIIRSLETTVRFLVISADNGYVAKIFLWDGTSASYRELPELPEKTAPVLVARDGIVYALGKQIYQLSDTTFATLFPPLHYLQSFSGGGNPVGPTLGSRTIWKDQVLFGMGATNLESNVDTPGGVWRFGKYSSPNPLTPYPETLTLQFLVPPYLSQQVQVGAIHSNRDDVLSVSYRNISASTFGVATLNTSSKLNSTASAYYITQPLTFDSDNKKIIHSIRLRLISEANTNPPTIDVYYRLDPDLIQTTPPAWTLAQTINAQVGDRDFTVGIRQPCRSIQYKFVFHAKTGASNQSAQLTSYTVLYELMDSYR